MSNYEQQLLWKKLNLSKAAKLKEESQKDNECTFAPTIYTNKPVKTVELSKSINNSGKAYIARQAKARKDVEDKKKRIAWTGKKQQEVHNQILNSSNASLNFDSIRVNNIESENHENNKEDIEYINGEIYTHNQSHSDLDSFGEEHVVELLEKERREWYAERMKLIQCIHLQQLELTQRSSAAHEVAVDIAKEFARVIEGFEERLANIEDNVGKEISSIKGIAESLKLSLEKHDLNHHNHHHSNNSTPLNNSSR